MPAPMTTRNWTAQDAALAALAVLAVFQFAYYFPGLPDYIPNKPSRPQAGMTTKWFLPAVTFFLLGLLAFANIALRKVSPAVLERLVQNPDVWLVPTSKAQSLAFVSQTLSRALVVYAANLLILTQGSYLLHYAPAGLGALWVIVGIFMLPLVSVAVVLALAMRFRAAPAV